MGLIGSLIGLMFLGFIIWICYAVLSKVGRMFVKTTKKNHYAYTTPYLPRKARR